MAVSTGSLEKVPILGCLHIYDSHKSTLESLCPLAELTPCGQGFWSYCSSSWWVCPGPNVTDLLSVDCAWNVPRKLPEFASHLDLSSHGWAIRFNVDHSNWLKLSSFFFCFCLFASESDHPIPRRGHFVLRYCKVEMSWGGQASKNTWKPKQGMLRSAVREGLKKKNQLREMGGLILFISEESSGSRVFHA